MAFLMMVMPNNLVLNGKVNFDPFDKKSVTLTSYCNEYCISNITEGQYRYNEYQIKQRSNGKFLHLLFVRCCGVQSC